VLPQSFEDRETGVIIGRRTSYLLDLESPHYFRVQDHVPIITWKQASRPHNKPVAYMPLLPGNDLAVGMPERPRVLERQLVDAGDQPCR
jgi:hypothetical protein